MVVRAVPTRLLGIFLFCIGVVNAGANQHDLRQVTVKKVNDGDTVQLASGEKIRLLGIDAPESKQPFYIQAKDALAALVEGRRVTLTQSENLVGAHGRTLAYLQLPNGVDVQQEMLKGGYAMVSVYPPDLDNLDEYLKIEGDARQKSAGIWGIPYFAVRDLDRGAGLRNGPGRIAGTITDVSQTGARIKITVSESFTIQIFHGFWRRFWPQQDAQKWIGQRVVAQGRIKAKRKEMIVRHPTMLSIGAATE